MTLKYSYRCTYGRHKMARFHADNINQFTSSCVLPPRDLIKDSQTTKMLFKKQSRPELEERVSPS